MQKQQNKKDSSLKIVKEVVRYFLPIVWKTRKSYFFLGSMRIVAGIGVVFFEDHDFATDY